jgi:hypothetical protein
MVQKGQKCEKTAFFSHPNPHFFTPRAFFLHLSKLSFPNFAPKLKP